MKTLELCSRCIMQLLLAACAAAFCLKLCTGCTYLKAVHNEAKPALAVALKDAYALGGATAVSNKIEQLVVENAPENRASDLEGRSRSDGEAARKGPRKVTPAQAAQLHILARCAVEALLRRAAEGEARAEGAQAAAALFDRAVERLEAEDLEAALTPTNAPAIQ